MAWVSVLLFLKDFLLGGVAGAVSKTVSAPIERVKLLLQLQDGSVRMRSREKRYDGVVDCVRSVLKEQGLLSFWRGNLTNVLRYFPTQAANLAFKDRYKRLFLQGVNKDTDPWTYFAGSVASGSAAGATSLCAMYPLDFARTRLTTDVGKLDEEREFTGLCDCLKKVVKSDGFLGLYRGFWISLLGIVVYRGAFFGFYDFSIDMIGKERLHFVTKCILAQVTTAIAGLLAYPCDTVRRRMMMQSGCTKDERLYKNSVHCAASIFRHEGPCAFFKGALTNIIRGVSSSLVLVLYDEFQRMFEQVFQMYSN